MGIASHRRDIRIPVPGEPAPHRSRPLCPAYETAPQAASISYVVIRILAVLRLAVRALGGDRGCLTF